MARRKRSKSQRQATVAASAPRRNYAPPVVLAPLIHERTILSLSRPTRATASHGRNSASEARARLSQHLERTQAARDVAEKHKRQSRLSLDPVEPDGNRSSDKARDRVTCKERPDSRVAARSPGSGSPRRFVPWCRR